jgi:hypothetical protein
MIFYLLVFVASYAISFVSIWLYISIRRSSLLPIIWVAVLAGLLGVYAIFLFRRKE